MNYSRILPAALSLCLGICTGLTGCSRTAAEMPATPPPTVTVAEPIQRDVTDYQEYTGQTASVDSVQVRARVSGYLDKIHFKDGADVKEGEVLYEIDPRPYKAALDQAEAQIRLQEAQAKYQESVYNRDLKLIGTGAVTQEE